MRLTTKITIGFILSIFLMTIIFIVYVAAIYEKEPALDKDSFKFTSIDIPNFSAIIIGIDPEIDTDRIVIQSNSFINLISDQNKEDIKEKSHPDAGTKGKLVLYEDLKPYIRFTVEDDTLKFYIKPYAELIKEWREETGTYNSLNLINMTLGIDSSFKYLQNDLQRINISVHSLKNKRTDLNLINGNVTLDQCSIDSLYAKAKHLDNSEFDNNGKLDLRDCNIRVLDIENRNKRFNWNSNNSHLNTVNLRGFINEATFSTFYQTTHRILKKNRKKDFERIRTPNGLKKVNIIREGDSTPFNVKILSDSVQLIFP